mgnify:CR=1 FL=1|jgi:hypothetical protein
MAQLGFNANDVAPSQGGGPLPPGEYTFHAVEEELKPNSKGTGHVLAMTYEVVEGEQAGRKVWVNMNVAHQNPKAQKIGQEELSALCHATGQMQVEDSQELLWKTFRAVTKVTTDDQGRERAEIKKYLFGDQPAPPASKPAATPPAGGPASSTPPAGGAGGANPLPWGGKVR